MFCEYGGNGSPEDGTKVNVVWDENIKRGEKAKIQFDYR